MKDVLRFPNPNIFTEWRPVNLCYWQPQHVLFQFLWLQSACSFLSGLSGDSKNILWQLECSKMIICFQYCQQFFSIFLFLYVLYTYVQTVAACWKGSVEFKGRVFPTFSRHCFICPSLSNSSLWRGHEPLELYELRMIWQITITVKQSERIKHHILLVIIWV